MNTILRENVRRMPWQTQDSINKCRKMGKGGMIMIFCEDCRNYERHYFEDQGYCEKKKKTAEATDTACDEFEPLEGQIRLEM